MTIRSSDLAWIVVSDLRKARKFFTETLGMKELAYNEDVKWLEISGHQSGSVIGVAEKGEHSPIGPGGNAIVTLTVDDLIESKNQLEKKGVKMVGDIIEIPGHVKMQMIQDLDNNYFQLVQILS